MTTRTPIRILAVALAMSLAPASQQAAAADTQEAVREEVQPAVLRVGAMRELKLPSAAAPIARDGDVIEIDAGIYDGDAAVWRQHRLTIRGVGGRAHLRANGAQAEDKAIWVVKGNDATIEGMEFSGAKVPEHNGAGIRLEGAGLTVRDCYFHDNENGILTSANPASDVVVEHSEFADNGFGDGYTHNLYIGNVRSFTLRFSYVHHALVGHNVKSRALRNTIVYNRIMDEKDGTSSYDIDLPNGGLSFVIGNVIQQGPATENPTIVSYGAEGFVHSVNEFYFVNNTVVNDRPAGGHFLFVRTGVDAARIVNNIFSGPGDVLTGPGELRNNVVAARTDFVDPADFDYRLRAGAAAIGRGIDPGSAHGFKLRPTAEYAHKAQTRARSNSGKLDAGALEYQREP
ncbi:MAG: right-handed parallel beta-helix repeat-containing protein [Burkholderiales bacterium]